MELEHRKHEHDVAQWAIIALGINKLVDNVFIEMKRTTKVHQESM